MPEEGQRLNRLGKLGYFLASNCKPILALWIGLLLGAAVLSAQFSEHLTGSANIVYGSDSQVVANQLVEEFSSLGRETDFYVVHSDIFEADSPQVRSIVAELAQESRRRSEVSAVVDPYNESLVSMISPDRRTILLPIALSGDDAALQAAAPDFQEIAQRNSSTDIAVQFTGSAPLAHAMVKQGDKDVETAEMVGLPAALLVLLIAFGSLVAASIPLALGLAGVIAALGLLGIASFFLHFDTLTQTAVVMVGIALGIDYSLFLVTRFREELAKCRELADAVPRSIAITVATAGQAVLFSGGTVFVALAGLLVVKSPLVRTMALGVMVTVLVMVLLTLLLLPAILGLIGGRINSFPLPWARRALATPDPERSIWARWTGFVMRRALPLGAAVTVVLLLAAFPILGLNYGIDRGTNAIQGSPAAIGYEVIAREFSAGTVAPVVMTVTRPTGSLSTDDLGSIARLQREVEKDGRVVGTVSVTSILDEIAGSHSAEALNQAVKSAPMDMAQVINESRDTTIISIFPRNAADSEESSKLVNDLRSLYVPSVADAGLKIRVGGTPAEIVDMTRENDRATPRVLACVLGASFLLLLLAFRSVVLAAKAVVMNLLSVAAAFGLLVLVFQEGVGASLFGVDRTGFIQVIIPLLVFALVFGLSMDYEVFMISRMKESWDRTHDNERAVREGITYTARVITAAAAIMVVVFAGFMFTRVLEIKQMGFAMAIAVVLDVTLVRLILVPSLMSLMGAWNWWMPSWLDRVIPGRGLGH